MGPNFLVPEKIVNGAQSRCAREPRQVNSTSAQGRFGQPERVALNPQPSTLNPEAGRASREVLCCSPSSPSMARFASRCLPARSSALTCSALAAAALWPILLLLAVAVSGEGPKERCPTCTCHGEDQSRSVPPTPTPACAIWARVSVCPTVTPPQTVRLVFAGTAIPHGL